MCSSIFYFLKNFPTPSSQHHPTLKLTRAIFNPLTPAQSLDFFFKKNQFWHITQLPLKNQPPSPQHNPLWHITQLPLKNQPPSPQHNPLWHNFPKTPNFLKNFSRFPNPLIPAQSQNLHPSQTIPLPTQRIGSYSIIQNNSFIVIR